MLMTIVVNTECLYIHIHIYIYIVVILWLSLEIDRGSSILNDAVDARNPEHPKDGQETLEIMGCKNHSLQLVNRISQPSTVQGLVTFQIKDHSTIGDVISNTYLKVMSEISNYRGIEDIHSKTTSSITSSITIV